MRAYTVVALMLALTACSGGGDGGNDAGACAVLSSVPCNPSAGGDGSGGPGGNTAAALSLDGLYSGLSESRRKVEGLILDDGTYWFIYHTDEQGTDVAGLVQGTAVPGSGFFFSSNGRDFEILAPEVRNLTLEGTFSPRRSVDGLIKYANGELDSFSALYDSGYEQTPTLTALAGRYVDEEATLDGGNAVTVTITNSGAISGQSVSGCTFNGNATPRVKGNVYDVSVTFNGGACALGTSTVSGIAYLDSATRSLVAAAVNNSRTQAFLFSGASNSGTGAPVAGSRGFSLQGLYSGTSDDGRAFKGLILDDGNFWFTYSSVSNDDRIAGLLQGLVSSSRQAGATADDFVAENVRDLDAEARAVRAALLDLRLTRKSSGAGVVSYENGEETGFTIQYDSGYEIAPTLATVAGTYAGDSATSRGIEAASATILTSGSISGQSASGCRYTGSIAPRVNGNVYNISLIFGGGACTHGNATLNGVAHFDVESRTLTATTLNSARVDGFLFEGVRP